MHQTTRGRNDMVISPVEYIEVLIGSKQTTKYKLFIRQDRSKNP